MPENTHTWQNEFPFAPHYFTAPSGHRLHFVDEGENQPAVMLHGNPTWSFFFRHLVTAVTAAGGRAVVPDHLGCGLSDKPKNGSYHLKDHIDNLEELVDRQLKLDSLDLVLHDWGGAIGMGYAVRHPEKIRRIVILNTAAFLMPDCPRRIRLLRCPGLGECLVQGGNVFVEAALRMAPHKPLSPQAKAGFRFPYDSWANRIATLKFVQDIPFSPKDISWQTLCDIQNRLPLLAAKKILICWGERDFCFTMKFLQRWKNLYPQASVRTYPQAGHYLLEDCADEIIPPVANFLTAQGEQP